MIENDGFLEGKGRQYRTTKPGDPFYAFNSWANIGDFQVGEDEVFFEMNGTVGRSPLSVASFSCVLEPDTARKMGINLIKAAAAADANKKKKKNERYLVITDSDGKQHTFINPVSVEAK